MALSERLKAASQAVRIDPRKVAVYIRWSTDDQGDGTTLEFQRKSCELFVQSQDWDINPDLIFIDDGFSGASLDRPALTRLRAAVRRGQVDCVVVHKLDRLSRSVLDTVNLVLDEWENRCHLKSATQPLDTRDPLGKQFFYMLVGFAEYERQIIKERTFSGKLTRASQGKNPGQVAPYGLGPGPAPGSFQVVPEEIAVVQRIFRESLAGVGTGALCRALNEEGVPYIDHRNGKRTVWKEVTIRYMLRNPLYTGRLVYGQSRVQARPRPGEPRRVRPEEPLVSLLVTLYAPDGAPLALPPVSPADFEEADRRIRARAQHKTSNRVRVSEHLLTGLLRCAACDMAMYGRKRQVSATGGTYSPAYYVCERARAGGGCRGGYIRQDEVDAAVVARVRARYGNAVSRQQIVAAALRETAERMAQAEGSLGEVQAALGAQEGQRAELRQEYIDRRITLEEYRDFKTHLDREYDAHKEQEQRLLDTLAGLRDACRAEAELDRLAGQLDAWADLTAEQKKLLLAELVARVTVHRPRGSAEMDVEIFWRHGGGDGEGEGALTV